MCYFRRAKSVGFMKETDYPYEDTAGKCRLDKDKVVARVSGGSRVLIKNEEQLKKLVYNYGPVIIGKTFCFLQLYWKLPGPTGVTRMVKCDLNVTLSDTHEVPK